MPTRKPKFAKELALPTHIKQKNIPPLKNKTLQTHSQADSKKMREPIGNIKGMSLDKKEGQPIARYKKICI